jgi:hypothetical protein
MSGEKGEFFRVFDNTLTCGWHFEDESKTDAIRRASIERVEFNTSNDNDMVSISVTADFGKRPMRAEDAKECIDEQIRRQPNAGSRFFPATRSYHIDFFFDGHDYKVAPASAAAARVFTHN